jgi:hypothetical protein
MHLLSYLNWFMNKFAAGEIMQAIKSAACVGVTSSAEK